MLGSSGLVGSPGGGGAAHVGTGGEAVVGSGGGESSSIMAGIGEEEKGRAGDGGGGGELFESERSGGGNRWPRQETLALLKIRSDMDVVFRDSSLKGPLWEDVSRKMAEHGYHRSAKKCKEKFENVYKYHKRTKEGRVGKADGKTYRFFDQLEALEQHHSSSLPPLPPHAAVEVAEPVTMVMPTGATVTVSSTAHPMSVIHPPPIPPQQQHHPVNPTNTQTFPVQPAMPVRSNPVQMENLTPSSPSEMATPSSSSSTSSDEELVGRRKRKRKWKEYFERAMREVVEKQEQSQRRFLEEVEKWEHDRMVREEAWKMQEMARLNREREILVQERSMAAAKDTAFISFLQKLSEQQQIPLQLPLQIQPQTKAQPQAHVPVHGATPVVPTSAPNHQSQPPPPQPQVLEKPVSSPSQLPPPAPQSLLQPQPLTQLPPPQQTAVVTSTSNTVTKVDFQKASFSNGDNHNNVVLPASSSRWPKAEVEALIKLRTTLDQKYQDNGPKGPLWEEISACMCKMGYNRSAKRCKEKWENINKYFKKVKESNKKRPEDSKTCPYFSQLDALYREKSKMEISSSINNNNNSSNIPSSYHSPTMAATNAVATATTTSNYGQVAQLMAAQQEQGWHSDDDDEGEEDEEDDQGSGYEIVANNGANSMSTTTAATVE